MSKESGIVFANDRSNQNIFVMKKYRCTVCDYIYDPEKGDPDAGIAPGTPFEQLDDDWRCPICGVGKDMFEPEE